MSDRPPSAGGILLVIAIFVGTGIGIAVGQSSLGFVIGLVVGIAAALISWRRDRTRDG